MQKSKLRSVRVSLDAFTGETVAPSPVGTLGARFSLGVVDAFFVRAADETVGDDYGLGGVLFEEGEDLLSNGVIGAHVGIFAEPAFKGVGLLAFVTHDGNNDFRSEFGRWAVEGDGSDRIAAKALLDFPTQPQ